MELEELDELFEDDAEIFEDIMNLKTYTVRERINHFEKWDEKEFHHRFRFTKNAVIGLEYDIINIMEPQNMQYHSINIRDQLLLTIRFYATGNFYITMGDFIGIHKSTASRIIKKITNALVMLRPQYIIFPHTEEDKVKIQRDFYEIAQFTKVIGAIDCTHIPIQSPGGEHAEIYRNRKGYFSLNVQAISNSRNYIMDLVVRWPGSCHDSHIFNNSSVKQKFENQEFVNTILLGDSGYPLLDYLMTPINNPMNLAEERYNQAHILTRTVIERTFGIWKRRFPILSVGMRCKLPLAQKIIIATAVLHNIAVLNREYIDENDGIEDINMYEHIDQPVNVNLGHNIVRQNYITYFQTL